MENKFLARLIKEFECLNKVPKFQLERAISPLLGIFINEIINTQLNANCVLSIPEFPIRPLKHKDDFQSTNIDWLLFDSKNNTLYLVEFKTDLNSLSNEQYKIYQDVKNQINYERNSSFLINDVENIKLKSDRPEKYQTIVDLVYDYDIKFTDYNKLVIVYFIPAEKKNFKIDSNDKFIFFDHLHNDIELKDFQEEWLQLLSFLNTLSEQYEKK